MARPSTDIFIDIETIPCQRHGVKERLAARVRPPATISKPETLERWEAESKPLAVEEAWRKTALSGNYGEIVCIAWAIGDAAVTAHTRSHRTSEDELLRTFYAALRGKRVERWVGHNVSGFDIPFLYKRSVIHNLVPSVPLPVHEPAWSRSVYDTMRQWEGMRGYVGLGELSEILDLGEKAADGSEVLAMWEAQRYDEIGRYCAQDVEITRRVFKRMTYN